MKKRLGPAERLYPMPCALVVGGTMEKADTLAVAWINVMSSTPPTIAMGLRESRKTLELMRETGTFTVNLPSASLVREVDYCGIASGHSADKFAATGLRLVPSAVVPTPIIEQCPFNIECRISGEHEVGSYRVIFGEIVETHADEAILAEDDAVDIAALDPLVYIPGLREYHRLGGKVADAYTVGRELLAE